MRSVIAAVLVRERTGSAQAKVASLRGLADASAGAMREVTAALEI
jgi:hypothetical protein